MRHRSFLAWSLLATLGSCTAEGAYRDYAEPTTVDDLQPLPQEATRQNARQVVRQCLQTQRRAGALPNERLGYAFREKGFVQIRRYTPAGQQHERIVRTYVDYAVITERTNEVFFDLPVLRERIRVKIAGKLRRWDSTINPYRSQPELDPEPPTVETDSLELLFDDALAAKRLTEALALLSGP